MPLLQDLYAAAPASLQTAFLNGYALWIHNHRYGHRLRAVSDQFEPHERWPPEQLTRYQDERLKVIAAHAYRHSHHYRQIFDEQGLDPRSLDVQSLRGLPLLTKETVRGRPSHLMTRTDADRGWLHGHTSGTTGTPLGIWYDRQTCVVNNAVDERNKRWAGMPRDAWIGLLLGRLVVPPSRRRPPFWRANHVHRHIWFSSFHLSEESLPAYLSEMRRRGLRYLEGYPSTLYVVARYLERRGQTLPLDAAFSSSETLLPMQRESIERAFECRLFDYYGLAERVIFAGECTEHSGKHVAEDYGVVEIVDARGEVVPDGEPGYLVGTSLHNLAMPMLRYRTSDVSAFVRGTCPCGRTFRRLQDITTKAEDFVVTPSGRLVSPSILTHPFKPLKGISASQIVQDRLDHLVVRLVPLADLDPAEEEKLKEGLRDRLGPDMHITVEHVDNIPRTPSGKLRWVVSNVQHEYRLDWEPKTS